MPESFSNRLIWVITFLVIAFIGFADSVYMTITHFKGQLPVCTILEGCDVVAMSTYSTIGPIPVALLGVLFYTAMLVVSIIWLDIRKTLIFRYLPFITVPAFLFSLWLIYIMSFVIEELCIYCLLSALTTTLLMLLSFRLRAMG